MLVKPDQDATTMDMRHVHSSNISSIGYDKKESFLVIRFTNGSLYKYYNVPPNVYHELMKATSHGGYFHAEIKGKYEYTKIG